MDNDRVTRQGENVWQARAAFYALFAHILSVPCSGAWGDEVFDLPMTEILQDVAGDSGLADMWRSIMDEAGAAGSAQRERYYGRLEECFQRNFLVPLPGQMIPLGAGAYLRDDQNQESRMAFFEGLYFEFSFDWRQVFAGTRCVWPNEPEHAVPVLTMLAVIAQKIATALAGDKDGRLPRYRHLLREIDTLAHPWLAQCLDRIASEAAEGFYRFFGAFMARFLDVDREQWELDVPA